ncbi:MAG: benzil reductase ((S)-benzoin forming) [Cellvibrionaceae bacterium]|jgi:benzil reductase ((S)-benzoin forming)
MKLAIITGGSRGLGASLAMQCKNDGFTVVDLSRSGTSAESVHIDLAKPETLNDVVPQLFTKLAGQSCEEVIFFNNAGMINPVGIVSDKAEDDVLANINVNFTSAILVMRHFIGAFQTVDCPKTIVNISSGAAISSIYGWSLYCGAKAGIEHFVRGVAAEQSVQTHPIKTLNIGPGIIDTGMQQDIRAVSAEDFPGVDKFISFKEEGALRQPEEVARAIKNILTSEQESGSRHNIQDFL